MHNFYDEMSEENFIREFARLADAIEVEMITSPSERPDFGEFQVRDPKDLFPGLRCVKHYKNGSSAGVITKVDLEKEKFTIQTVAGHVFEEYMTDAGILPYRGRGMNGEDVWNPTNWIEWRI